MTAKYPVFEKWSRTLDWILDTVEKYPRSARFTLSGRIANIGLDVMEKIIEAIYTKDRLPILRMINLYLEKLRVLFRISMERKYLSLRQFEFIAGELRESGQMIGGWQKHEAGRQPVSPNR